ncbi:MAG: ATPase domain-containing protein [Thiogranum sp.]|nr:ATPase domain-containing protein [Thiogranum sp.]
MNDLPLPYLPSGVQGLDTILNGGLQCGCLYLVEGSAGTGKTTLALQFLLEGVRRGETCLFIALSETVREIEVMAASHGWELEPVQVVTLKRMPDSALEDSLFDVSDVEQDERVNQVLEQISATGPGRVVIDTLSCLRADGAHPVRFRDVMVALRQRLDEIGCTVMMVDETQRIGPQAAPYSLAWGVIRLEQVIDDFGPLRRRLCVLKVRGQEYATGYHDFSIRRGGLRVYPSLLAPPPAVEPAPGLISSGITEIDRLLGGGVEPGTSVGITGPPGCGKSMLALQYARAAAERGEQTAIYLFDESPNMPALRARSEGLDLRTHLASGRIYLRSISHAEMSFGELAADILQRVEQGVRAVVLDSLNGYRDAMSDAAPVAARLLLLLGHLRARGAVVFMTLEQQNGPQPIDIGYLADTVIMQRYFETAGAVRYAVSVLKKRYGDHERTVREYSMRDGGMQVSEPMLGFTGVLGAVPVYTGGEPSR